jgi:hypothetical protein
MKSTQLEVGNSYQLLQIILILQIRCTQSYAEVGKENKKFKISQMPWQKYFIMITIESEI